MEAPSSTRVNLGELLADALKRRLYPATNLHAKQLCYALQISEATLWKWLNGTAPGGENLLRLMAFFDQAFSAEISRGRVVKMTDARALDAIRRLDEAKRDLLEAMGGQG